MYEWRAMTPKEREEILRLRQQQGRPWHSPPHLRYDGDHSYLLTAACYEHAHIIGTTPRRMVECEQGALAACQSAGAHVFAWCILPNHYHLVLRTDRVKEACRQLGLFHGRSSHRWNGQEGRRGRQVWHNCVERRMRSERHFWATLNYVHHNAVHHGYVERWDDWPFSSAPEFLGRVGREEAQRIWRLYPVLDYGKKWDL